MGAIQQPQSNRDAILGMPRGRTTLMGIVRMITRHWITAIVTFVVIMSACVFQMMRSSVTYSSDAQVYAQYNEMPQDDALDSSYLRGQVGVYGAMAESDIVLGRVIDDFHLDMTTTQLADQVKTSSVGDTPIITITVSNQIPGQSAKLANAIAAMLCTVVNGDQDGSDAQSPIKLTILRQAIAEETVSGRGKKLIVLGVIVGVILAVFAALLKDLLSSRIQDDEDVCLIVPMPVIGRVPKTKMLQTFTPAVITEPQSAIAEDFRSIRAALQSDALRVQNAEPIVLASAQPADGSTTMAVNLAAAYAELNKRVLLVDANLSNPGTTDAVNAHGLSDVLQETCEWQDAISRDTVSGVDLLCAGTPVTNPSPLLHSMRAQKLLESFNEAYDVVVIDTTALNITDEALALTRRIGRLVLVVRRGVTRKHALQEIADQLRSRYMQCVGVIVNNAQTWR